MIVPGEIIIWPSTNASIPAGFVRETALDGFHIKQTSTGIDPGVTGGSNTHTHTSVAHSHQVNEHQHSGQTSRDSDFETHGGGCRNCVARDQHIHDFTSSFTSGNTSSDAPSSAAGNSEPPYMELIFIRATAYTFVPNGAVVLFDQSTLPPAYVDCDGLNGTVNLIDKFLKGATASGNSGATGGTSAHTHAVNHSHSSASHYHTGQTGYDSDCCRDYDTWSGGGSVVPRHTHSFTLNSTSTTPGTTNVTCGGETVEPAYIKLRAIMNTGTPTVYKNMITLWLGTLATIPGGKKLCNGNNGTPNMLDRYVKITATTSALKTTGGSHTHGHVASGSHGHTDTGTHTHSGSTDSQPQVGTTIATNDGAAKGHSHTINDAHGGNCSSTTASWANNTIVLNSTNGEPAYKTVAYIQARSSGGMLQIIG